MPRCLWHLELGEMYGLTKMQLEYINLEILGQIFRQADYFNFGSYLCQHAAVQFHANTLFGIHRMDRHDHVDRLFLVDAEKVGVQDPFLERVALQIA